MAVKDLFSHGKKVSRDSMRHNYREDRTFRKIMEDPKIKKILNSPEEQRELHSMMEEKAADGSVSGNDMRVIFNDLAHKGKGKFISSDEGRQMASQVFTDSSRRYLSDKEVSSKNASSSATPARSRYKSERINMPSPTGQATKLSPAFFANRLKPANSSKLKKKTSFFDSMKSVQKNKN